MYVTLIPAICFGSGDSQSDSSYLGQQRNAPYRSGQHRDSTLRSGPSRDNCGSNPPWGNASRDNSMRGGPSRDSPYRTHPYRRGPNMDNPARDRINSYRAYGLLVCLVAWLDGGKCKFCMCSKLYVVALISHHPSSFDEVIMI